MPGTRTSEEASRSAERDSPGKRDEQREAPERDRNEGEGSRSADRAYRRGLEEFENEGRVEGQAEEAERALEGPEAEALRKAEQQGKRGPRPS